MWLVYSENCIILTSTDFDWSNHASEIWTDGWMDRQVIPYSALLSLDICCHVHGDFTTGIWVLVTGTEMHTQMPIPSTEQDKCN